MMTTTIRLFLMMTFFAPTAVLAEPEYSKAFDSCMDGSGGVTVKMLECVDAEIKKQDKKLNENYKTLMTALNASRKNGLKNAQRLWIKYRDANCHFYYDPDGGTIQSILSSDCLLRMTAERADELLALKEMTLQTDVAAEVELDETSGLNGINGSMDFPIRNHEKHLPGFTAKLVKKECETGECEYMILSNAGKEVVTIEGHNGKVSTIRVTGRDIVPLVEGRIGDVLGSFIWAADQKRYTAYCAPGMEGDSGKIICKTRTASKDDTSHIRHVFSGDYQGPDGELPPLETAKKFKIVATIWQK